jgi:hypothetical protein
MESAPQRSMLAATRGGSRKGAGRPNGRDHKSINVSLPIYLIEYLKTYEPARNRSEWIASAIKYCLSKEEL